MPRDLKITRLIITHFDWECADMDFEAPLGFDTVYTPGASVPSGGSILRIETSAGI